MKKVFFVFNEAETRSRWFQEVLKEKGISFIVVPADEFVGSNLDNLLARVDHMSDKAEKIVFVDCPVQLETQLEKSDKYETLAWCKAVDLLYIIGPLVPISEQISLVGKYLPFCEMKKIFQTFMLKRHLEEIE